MDKGIKLERVVFLDENRSNPLCYACEQELSGFLITEKQIYDYFSQENIDYLTKNNYILLTEKYDPKLIIYLCRNCSEAKGEK